MIDKININNNEISFYYEQTNHKYTLLFLHGFASSKNIIISTLSKFQNRNYNIIAFDYPGCGQSKTKNEQTIENYQAITKEFIEKVCPNNTIIMGHSLGTLSAVYINNNPKIVGTILMSSINPWYVPKEYIQLISLLLPRNIEDAKLSLMYIANSLKNFGSSIDKVAEFFLNSEHDNRKIFYNLLTKQSLNPKYLDKHIKPLFLNLKNKLSFIHGEKDRMIDPIEIKNLAKKLNASLYLMKNTGHSPMFEQPKEINEYLINYINKLNK